MFLFLFGGGLAYCHPVIDSEEKLAPWLDKIEACPVIGLDTEADSLYSYPERLCLLQLALADDLLLIDPLSDLNLQPLWHRLKKAELVIHAADYDLRLLAGHCGFAPPRVFDTMRAAQFLGLRELALQRLVSHFFQVRLEKGARKRSHCRQQALVWNCLLFLIVVFAGYSLYLGKEALVKEAVKLLGVLVAGIISGCQWGERSRGK